MVIKFPGPSTIHAVRDAMCFGLCVLSGVSMAGIDGNKAGYPTLAEAARIPLIHHDTAGKDHLAIVFRDRDGEFLPVQQIATDRMAPTHVAPCVATRVVLIEKMVFPFEKHQAVWIIGPVLFG